MESNSPLISIIVPVYNVEKYLRECLNSIVTQNCDSVEILLVDDGSTDGSGKICDEYALQYDYIRVFHKLNGGLSSARNRGIQESIAEWILFVDSDDILRDDTIRILKSKLKRNIDLIRFEYFLVNDDGIELPEVNSIRNKLNIFHCELDSYDMVRRGINREWFSVLFLLKRDAIGLLRFDETVKYQEDIDFFLRFFSNENLKGLYIPDKLYGYRQRAYSLTNSLNINKFKYSFIIGEKFNKYSHLIQNKKFSKLYYYYGIMMYYWTLSSLCEDPYYSKRHAIKDKLEINSFNNSIKKRLRWSKQIFLYYPFIIPSPSVSMVLLRIKNNIVKFISLKLK